jgi:hypothetical protein
MTSKIRGKRDFNLLYSRIVLIHINKANELIVDLRLHNLWGKCQGSQSNVGDMKETICTQISLKRKA